MRIVLVYLLAIGIGFIDVAVKGFWNWNDLPAFVQGWSWHIFLFLVYVGYLALIAKIMKFNLLEIIAGLLIWSVEDLTFYLLKSLFTWHLYWNDWFGFFSPEHYFLTVLDMNVLALILFYIAREYRRG